MMNGSWNLNIPVSLTLVGKGNRVGRGKETLTYVLHCLPEFPSKIGPHAHRGNVLINAPWIDFLPFLAHFPGFLRSPPELTTQILISRSASGATFPEDTESDLNQAPTLQWVG